MTGEFSEGHEERLKGLVQETDSRQTEKGTRAGWVTRLIEKRRLYTWDNL